MPVKDVAALGGWKCASVVTDIYQRADDEGMLRALTQPMELRELPVEETEEAAD
jgi:hypothetical protein